MNETNLIERLNHNIKIGDNCPKASTNNPGSTSRADKLAEDVKKAIANPPKQKSNGDYEMVNHPKHYNSYDVEVIEMMRRLWGTEATILFCKLNAFKYRMRMGMKPGQSVSQDLEKEKWYLEKAEELKTLLN